MEIEISILLGIVNLAVLLIGGTWKLAAIKSELKEEISAMRNDITGVRTQMIGVDGHNGMRSDVRELKQTIDKLHIMVKDIDHRVTVMESQD